MKEALTMNNEDKGIIPFIIGVWCLGMSVLFFIIGQSVNQNAWKTGLLLLINGVLFTIWGAKPIMPPWSKLMNNETKGVILVILGGSLVIIALFIFFPANLASDTLSFNKGSETLQFLVPGILLLVLGFKIMSKYDPDQVQQMKRQTYLGKGTRPY